MHTGRSKLHYQKPAIPNSDSSREEIILTFVQIYIEEYRVFLVWFLTEYTVPEMVVMVNVYRYISAVLVNLKSVSFGGRLRIYPICRLNMKNPVLNFN